MFNSHRKKEYLLFCWSTTKVRSVFVLTNHKIKNCYCVDQAPKAVSLLLLFQRTQEDSIVLQSKGLGIVVLQEDSFLVLGFSRNDHFSRLSCIKMKHYLYWNSGKVSLAIFSPNLFNVNLLLGLGCFICFISGIEYGALALK